MSREYQYTVDRKKWFCFTWALWAARNKFIFEGYLPRRPRWLKLVITCEEIIPQQGMVELLFRVCLDVPIANLYVLLSVLCLFFSSNVWARFIPLWFCDRMFVVSIHPLLYMYASYNFQII